MYLDVGADGSVGGVELRADCGDDGCEGGGGAGGENARQRCGLIRFALTVA